jgi:peptide deformylase
MILMGLKIAQLGQPVLRQAAQEVPEVEIATPEFQRFVEEMRATLVEAKGAGLAGPQVFSDQRIFLAAVLPPLERDGPRQIEVFINPRFTAASPEKAYGWEGCLSFPELLVLVERHKAVRIEYLNSAGELKGLDLVDFPARIVQHEFDHLQGILTIDRAPSTRYIIKGSELDAFLAEEERQAGSDEAEGSTGKDS